MTVSTFAVADKDLSFTCPNKVPDNAPQPIINLNDLEDLPKGRVGISTKLNVTAASSTVYAQFQAAIALVPCDQEPISVFIPANLKIDSSNPHDRYSVAVIYSDKPSTYEIKDWAL